MSEQFNTPASAPSAAENGKESKSATSREVEFATADECIDALRKTRESITDEKEQKKFAKTWKQLGGEAVEAAQAKVDANPEDKTAKRELARAKARMHEAYQNGTNEFSKTSQEDRDELKKMLAAEIATFDDATFHQQVTSLRQELMRDGGITRSQADALIARAKQLNESFESGEGNNESDPASKKAPKDLPTTANVKKAAKSIDDNKTRAGVTRRTWDFLNVKAGNGMYHVGEFLTRKNEEGTKRKPEETDEQYEKRMKRKGTVATLGAVGIGASLLAWKFVAMKAGMDPNAIDEAMVNGEVGAENLGYGSLGPLNPEDIYNSTKDYPSGSLDNLTDSALLGPLEEQEAGTLTDIEDATRAAELGGVDMFEGTMFDGYNPAEDAFNQPGKTGPNNWGVAVPTELAEGAQFDVAGLDELINQSWATSPEQLAAIAAERELEGFTMGNIEEMAAQMKDNPAFARDTYMSMLEFLNAEDTVISEGAPLEPGTYGSYYETMIDGDGVISYDNVVNEPGTVIKIEYTDENGVRQVMELKRECGGQVIHRHPVEEVVPQGGAQPAAPQQTYTTPAETHPVGGGAPPANNPPTDGGNPPIDNPPTGGGNPPGGGENPTPTPNENKDWGLIPDEDGWTFDDTLYEETEDPSVVGNGTASQNLDPATQPDSQAEGAVAQEATAGTGGTRAEAGVGNQGAGAVEADLGQSHDSATDTSAGEAGATTDDNKGQALDNPFTN